MKLKNILKRKKKKGLATLYDKHNNPIIPPKGSRYSKKIRHKLQYPSNFTEKEIKEILDTKLP